MEIKVRHVPPELHTAVKLTAVSQGSTINDLVLRLLEEYVKREKVAPYRAKK